MTTRTPNKEHIQLWVDALRSGEYAQGTGRLRSPGDGDEFCCLGVACDVTPYEWKADEDGYWQFMGEGGLLPRVVADWLGIDQSPRTVTSTYPGLAETAMPLFQLNDTYRFSFAQIADLLERDYLRE